MNLTQYGKIYDSLDTTVKKLFNSMTASEPKEIKLIARDFHRIYPSNKMSIAEISGCLSKLKVRGLVREPTKGTFEKLPVPQAQVKTEPVRATVAVTVEPPKPVLGDILADALRTRTSPVVATAEPVDEELFNPSEVGSPVPTKVEPVWIRLRPGKKTLDWSLLDAMEVGDLIFAEAKGFTVRQAVTKRGYVGCILVFDGWCAFERMRRTKSGSTIEVREHVQPLQITQYITNHQAVYDMTKQTAAQRKDPTTPVVQNEAVVKVTDTQVVAPAPQVQPIIEVKKEAMETTQPKPVASEEEKKLWTRVFDTTFEKTGDAVKATDAAEKAASAWKARFGQ